MKDVLGQDPYGSADEEMPRKYEATPEGDEMTLPHVPSWAELPNNVRDDFVSAGVERWYATASREQRLSLINAYLKMRYHGLWQYVDWPVDPQHCGLGNFVFYTRDVSKFRRALSRHASFSKPERTRGRKVWEFLQWATKGKTGGELEWESREQVIDGAVHFKNFRGPSNRIQIHVDRKGLPDNASLTTYSDHGRDEAARGWEKVDDIYLMLRAQGYTTHTPIVQQSKPDHFTGITRPDFGQSRLPPLTPRRIPTVGQYFTRFTTPPGLGQSTLPPMRPPPKPMSYFTRFTKPDFGQSKLLTLRPRLTPMVQQSQPDYFTRLTKPDFGQSKLPPLRSRLAPTLRRPYFTGLTKPEFGQSKLPPPRARPTPVVQQSRPDYFTELTRPDFGQSRP